MIYNSIYDSDDEFDKDNDNNEEDETIIDELMKSLLSKINNDKKEVIKLEETNNAKKITLTNKNKIKKKNCSKSNQKIKNEKVVKQYQIIMDCNESEYIIYYKM